MLLLDKYVAATSHLQATVARIQLKTGAELSEAKKASSVARAECV
jgi:hypothetical protein